MIDHEKRKFVKSSSQDRFSQLYETSFEYQKNKEKKRLSY